MKKLIPEDLTDLVFLDLETPGLEATDGPPLQLGMLHVQLAEGIRDTFDQVRYVRQEEVERWDPFILDMHTSSGLLGRCVAAPGDYGHRKMQREAVDWLNNVRRNISRRKYGKANVEFEPLVMAGGGVDRFDRPYLRQWMPEVDAQFHYWTIDSSVTERTIKSWGFELPDDLSQHADGLVEHLALDDCIDSWNRYSALKRHLVDGNLRLREPVA